MPTTTKAPSDPQLVQNILERIAQSLTTILGHAFPLQVDSVERSNARPAGEGVVHISFKLDLLQGGERKGQGSLLIPLPDAMTMAAFLLMLPEESVTTQRGESNPDQALKDAMLEVGRSIGSACSAALGNCTSGWSARSAGCQGVRADVRPALDYVEGHELVVARFSSHFDPWEPFEGLLILPPLT
jgi:hypothetical protein